MVSVFVRLTIYTLGLLVWQGVAMIGGLRWLNSWLSVEWALVSLPALAWVTALGYHLVWNHGLAAILGWAGGVESAFDDVRNPQPDSESSVVVLQGANF